MQVTIQLSDELEQKLTERALQLNTSLENLILDSLTDLVEPVDPDAPLKTSSSKGSRYP